MPIYKVLRDNNIQSLNDIGNKISIDTLIFDLVYGNLTNLQIDEFVIGDLRLVIKEGNGEWRAARPAS